MTSEDHSQERGRQTRADIVQVARRLFSEYGYFGTSLSDIQDATGLTKGAFYHHFSTKEDLALAVLECARGDYQKHLLAPFEDLPAGERFAATLDAIYLLNAQPEWRNCQMLATLCAELTNQEPRLQEAVRKLQQGMFGFFRDLIQGAQKAGDTCPGVVPEVYAQWIVSTLTGTQVARKLGSACVAPDQIFKAIKSAVLKHPGP